MHGTLRERSVVVGVVEDVEFHSASFLVSTLNFMFVWLAYRSSTDAV